MSEPFLGEIKMVGFNFAPSHWAACDGQILPINQNQALYALLGTTYGGDGRTSFALPDLRGRVALDQGDGYVRGRQGGDESVTLDTAQMAAHTHTVNASSEPGDAAAITGQQNQLFANGGNFPLYHAPSNPVAMNADSITKTGGGQSHTNVQPSVVVNFVIALNGTFPPRN